MYKLFLLLCYTPLIVQFCLVYLPPFVLREVDWGFLSPHFILFFQSGSEGVFNFRSESKALCRFLFQSRSLAVQTVASDIYLISLHQNERFLSTVPG